MYIYMCSLEHDGLLFVYYMFVFVFMVFCPYIYMYSRCRGPLDREIIRFVRACVYGRSGCLQWNWISKIAGRPFPFSLWALGGLGESSDLRHKIANSQDS